MLWIKALHIIFVVTWLPEFLPAARLFAITRCRGHGGRQRFKLMERKLYWASCPAER